MSPRASLDLGVEALGDVGARGGRALLALELEGAAQQRHGQGLRLGAGMREDEVLAAGLAHQARIALVPLDVGAHGLPHPLEDRGRAREMHPGQIRGIEYEAADLGGGPVTMLMTPSGRPAALKSFMRKCAV